MSQTPPLTIHFENRDAANQLVAGIPAAARALKSIAGSSVNCDPVVIAVRGGWEPSSFCCQEAARLAPDVDWSPVDAVTSLGDRHCGGAAIQSGDPVALSPELAFEAYRPQGDPSMLDEASRRIVKATGKAADGIVSRHLNRPISQTLTRLMLRSSWARPGHATLFAGALGIAMVAALFLGGAAGLIIGAVLYQCASIVDGVDGEMARATFRSSERGAMLDSVTDTATNLGFLAGVSFNVWDQGMIEAAWAGTVGFAALAFGSFLLAVAARRAGGAFTFDALKHRFREKPSALKQALTYITMRDFYALAACLAIVVGAVQPLLFAFAVIASGWLAVVCFAFLFADLGGRRA